MRVIPLGTSSGTPTRDRNVSALAVAFDHRWLLLDCGEGTQQRILHSDLRIHQLEGILLTHLHGDHLFGLPGLLGTLSMQKRTAPLWVCGPAGLKAFLEVVIQVTESRVTRPLEIREIPLDAESFSFAQTGYSVLALPLDHRVPSFGYRIETAPKLGQFFPDKAHALGIVPGPAYRELQFGKAIQLPNGRKIESHEVLGPGRPGIRVAYCTDTRPCTNAARLSENVDLMIHETTYLDDLRELAHERGHSTTLDAARIALEAKAKRLLITHFSPRYKDPETLADEARTVFSATHAARDLVAIHVGRSKDPVQEQTAA